MKNNKIQWKPLFISLLISFGVEIISGLLTMGSMEKYEQLYKPPLSPPGYVFPVVWTVLFLFMGIASYLVYVSDSPHREQALIAYGIQLLVNMAWSVLFFNLDAYLFAFAWLILLWYLVYKMAKRFYAIEPLAGKLMYFYLIWITFAGYLNLMIALHYS